MIYFGYFLNVFNAHVVIMFFICFILQEEVVKKKYGGLMPKKPPLISKVALTFLHNFVMHSEYSF